jgi:hypothetical protein
VGVGHHGDAHHAIIAPPRDPGIGAVRGLRFRS